MDAGQAVSVEDASKKYARSLWRVMRYGATDIARDFAGLAPNGGTLRKDEFWAVQDAAFAVAPGECVALLGPNGAGKSTLLKMLNGIVLPDRGRIAMRGRVGALIEVGAGFHPMLSGRENIFINGAILGLSTREIRQRFDAIVDFAELGEFIDSPVKYYSSGMYVRLGFAVAAHVEPDILLIDEVLAVGDVGFRMKCFRHLLQLLDRGTSIVLVSHAVNQLSRVTDRAVVFQQSRQVFDGPLTEGVGVYHHALKVDAPEAAHAGPTAIAAVTVVDAEGNLCADWQTGEDLYADIELRSEARVAGARLIVAVESPALGVLGSVSTPHAAFEFDLEPPGTTLRMCLPDLPLLVGGYHLNVSLFGPAIEDFYDRRTPAATFRVTGPPTNAFGFGLSDHIRFQHRWEHRPSP